MFLLTCISNLLIQEDDEGVVGISDKHGDMSSGSESVDAINFPSDLTSEEKKTILDEWKKNAFRVLKRALGARF